MSKDFFIAAHEEMIEQFRIDHPDATWCEAYDATADDIYDNYRDRMADMIDGARLQAKEGRTS